MILAGVVVAGLITAFFLPMLVATGIIIVSTMLSIASVAASRRICSARVKVIAPPKPSTKPRPVKAAACCSLPLNACAMP